MFGFLVVEDLEDLVSFLVFSSFLDSSFGLETFTALDFGADSDLISLSISFLAASLS
ncbi:hypothetical protein CP02DC21_2029, partial [Chlamydia psittaci 02DC21]